MMLVFGETMAGYPGSSGSVVDRHSETWPFLLEQKLRQPVRNCLVTNEPIAHALDRLQDDCLELRPHTALLQFGATDSCLTEQEQPTTAPARFRRDLQRLLTRVKRAGIRPVLLTPNPLTGSFPGYMERQTYQRRGVNCSLEKYVRIIRDTAAVRRVPLVDFFRLFPKQPHWEELLFAGSTPNPAGSRFIADRLARRLRVPPARPALTVVALGDSVTYSMGVPGVDRHAKTWRRLLEHELNRRGFSVLVRNAGIACDRTVQGAARLAADALARRPQIVLICFGLNDGWITNAQLPVVTDQLYARKLRAMIRACRQSRVRPILLSPSPMTWRYYQNYFQRPLYRQHGVNCRIETFTTVMERVARAERVPFVNIFATFRNHPQWNEKHNRLVEDGLHPGPAGNQFWAQHLAEQLGPIIRNP